jgi:hypothetical protein
MFLIGPQKRIGYNVFLVYSFVYNECVWHYQFKCVRACFMFKLKGTKNSLKALLFLKDMLWVEIIILELIMTRAIPHVNNVFWSE